MVCDCLVCKDKCKVRQRQQRHSDGVLREGIERFGRGVMFSVLSRVY